MKALLAVSFFTLVASTMCLAQERSSTCPDISVSGPPGVVTVNGLARYAANVEFGENNKQDLQYIWSTSTGEIVNGQGTASIEIRQPDQGLTVTVQVKGLPPGCPDTALQHNTGGCGFELPVKLGQFTPRDLKRYDVDLNGIVQAMNDNPNNQLFVYFVYEKKPTSQPSFLREREVIDHVATTIGGRERITSVRVAGGVELIQFWRVPPGAENPDCEKCVAPSCPTIAITGPAGVPKPGEQVEFSVRVSGDVPGSATYRWTVTDDGQIVEGQGTLRIRVQAAKKNTCSFDIAATFELLGLNSGCANQATASAPVASSCSPLLMDEFGRLPLRERTRRIETAVHWLRERSNTKVLFIEYFVKGSSQATINGRVRWLTYQMRRRKVLPAEFEILTADSFDGEPRTKIYFIPPGTSNPEP